MELLDPVISSEMDGIEVFCSYHGEREREFFREYGEKRGLILTCGSDYHGKIKPSVSIGGHGYTLDQEVMKEYVERLVSR